MIRKNSAGIARLTLTTLVSGTSELDAQTIQDAFHVLLAPSFGGGVVDPSN